MIGCWQGQAGCWKSAVGLNRFLKAWQLKAAEAEDGFRV